MSTRWLLRPAPRTGASLRLFCFPYAGVGASVYRLWPAGLPAAVDVCMVQLPGRETRLREPALDSIPALVEALVPELMPHLDLPFAFFGHSMGSIVASATAQALAERGAPMPQQLIFSGRRAPHVPDPDSPLRHLDDDEFTAEIDRRYGGIPAQVRADRELMALLLPALRADIAALETYRPAPSAPFVCPVAVFGGDQDSRAPRAHLEAWRAQAAGEFGVRVFSGDHFYLNPRRAEVLAAITAILEPLLARLPPPPSEAVA